MQTLHAIYENGVFRPTEAVDLPDDCEVEIRIQARRTVMERPTL
ncbi:MAG: antitoxin family protein, partial [Candidatus Competibacter denitrificans]